VIDTTRLALDRRQIGAERTAVSARVSESERQIAVLAVQREIAGRAYARTRRLFAEQAATAQQLDQAERDYRVLGEQIAALRAQRNSVTQDVAASEARVAQIADRIAKSKISAPFAGTVLATYARAGEYVQPGQPLFRIASLDTLTLRAYVTEPQLAQLKLGQHVQVSVDRGEKSRLSFSGTVSWIASKAEFTPTPIQTRDERADLVYAVKILVSNRDGMLKIGMPADVTLPALART
jgi:HlyD family secretion protein